MNFKYHQSLLIAVIISLLTTTAVNGNDRATRKFEMAISACEKGLQMKMPKSKGALVILQNQFKKYQRHRDDALKLDESLKSSEEKRHTGSFFVRKTFSEAYQTCEHDFPEKLAAAEMTVKKTAENIESRQAQQDITPAKTTAADPEMVLAIDNYCATYLLKPEGISSPLYSKYQAAKQKVLELHPDIVNQFHAATITEIGTDKPTNLNKTIRAWFEYCDAAFTQPVGTMKSPTPPETNSPEPAREPSSSGSSVPLPQKTIATPRQRNETTSAQQTGTTPAPTSQKTTITPPQETETTPAQQLKSTTPTPTSESESKQETKPIQTTGPIPSSETGSTSVPESVPTPPPVTHVTTTPPGDNTTSVEPTPGKDKSESATTDSDKTKHATVSNGTPPTAEAEEVASVSTDNADTNADTDEGEYKSVMAKMQGDRLKVLKEEKRLPDFVDDEDYNYQKATTWQYEKADGKKCTIYGFKGNQLINTNKNAGACPPFPTKE